MESPHTDTWSASGDEHSIDLKTAPNANVTPVFNPTGAPEDEIVVRGIVPERMRSKWGWGTYQEKTGSNEPVTIWRVEERARIENGEGLTSSRVLRNNTVGDIDEFHKNGNIGSNHTMRMGSEAHATPFVSFSTNPAGLAENLIVGKGVGIAGSRDSVVVEVQVDPDRILALNDGGQQREVLLLGGVAEEEYIGAYEVSDFVHGVLDSEAEFAVHRGGRQTAAAALLHWTQGS